MLDGLTGLFPIDIIVVADNLGKNGLQLDFHEQLVAGALLPEFLHNLHHKGKNAAGGGIVPIQPVGKILAVFKKDQQEIIIEIAGQGVPDKGGVEMDDQIVHFLAVGQLQSMIICIGQDKYVARADIVELLVDMIRAVARGHAGNFQLVVGMSFSRHRADEHMAVDGNQLAAVLIQNGAGGRER